MQRQNAERVQGRYPPFSQPYTLQDTSSVVSSSPQPLPCTSNPGIPSIAKEVLASYVAPPDIQLVAERVSRQAFPNLHRRKCCSRFRSKSQHVHHTLTLVRSSWTTSLQARSVSELLSTGQGAVFHRLSTT